MNTRAARYYGATSHLGSPSFISTMIKAVPFVLIWVVATTGQQVALDLRAQRTNFQKQELIPSHSGNWVFQVGKAPRLIWRDIDEIRRLGGPVDIKIRWFNSKLEEAKEPDKPGRWLAWVEGKAPNGTPFRRAFTFFAFPKKIVPGFVPDLTVTLPNFPGPDAPPAWAEHQFEFDRAGREFLMHGLMNTEKGAILMAGIAESRPLGRPKRFVESTTVINAQHHLALKLKLQGLTKKVKRVRPARILGTQSPVLREEALESAKIPKDAKSKIDQYCQDWVAATGEPFVTLVAKNGVIITHEAFGKDPQGQPINREYRCWLASITKTVTALMFSQLVDQGLVQFDAPISTVFPDYPADSRHVPTFRQCLNHTSGLSGHGDFGGMNHPHLENVILNGIDTNEPGKAQVYSGLGFELTAKAMENISGTNAAKLYHDRLFTPLGFGDVVLRNASSDCELTVLELATLGQLIANRGNYGDRQFISSTTFKQLLPPTLDMPQKGKVVHGLGMHSIRHLKAGAKPNSDNTDDYLFSLQTVGHGSFSGCILVVDLEQKLVITQVRRKFGKEDSKWWKEFFRVIAEAIEAKSK